MSEADVVRALEAALGDAMEQVEREEAAVEVEHSGGATASADAHRVAAAGEAVGNKSAVANASPGPNAGASAAMSSGSVPTNGSGARTSAEDDDTPPPRRRHILGFAFHHSRMYGFADTSSPRAADVAVRLLNGEVMLNGVRLKVSRPHDWAGDTGAGVVIGATASTVQAALRAGGGRGSSATVEAGGGVAIGPSTVGGVTAARGSHGASTGDVMDGAHHRVGTSSAARIDPPSSAPAGTTQDVGRADRNRDWDRYASAAAGTTSADGANGNAGFAISIGPITAATAAATIVTADALEAIRRRIAGGGDVAAAVPASGSSAAAAAEVTAVPAAVGRRGAKRWTGGDVEQTASIAPAAAAAAAGSLADGGAVAAAATVSSAGTAASNDATSAAAPLTAPAPVVPYGPPPSLTANLPPLLGALSRFCAWLAVKGAPQVLLATHAYQYPHFSLSQARAVAPLRSMRSPQAPAS